MRERKRVKRDEAGNFLPRRLLAAGVMVILCGCVTAKELKESKPIVQNKDYEKLLLGNPEAEYVGNETCLKNCHVHDKLKEHFDGSTMGVQLRISSSGMMIVDCESCHGPASAALAELESLKLVPQKTLDTIPSEKQTQIRAIMKKNFSWANDMPAQVRSHICLKCHTANATFNLHNWNAGPHAINEVSCSDCHPVHVSADLFTRPADIAAMCEKCHKEVAVEFSLPSHHPVKEKKVFCTDCHSPHGTSNPKLLLGSTVKETCARCHPEKAGPFLFEHGDVTEDCTNCHNQHGSVNDNLLKLQNPFLCKQCHIEHRLFPVASNAIQVQFYTRCTDCHSEIHGTDTPGATNTGRFTQ